MRHSYDPDADQLKQQIYFVHFTHIVPHEGVLIPGNVCVLDLYQDTLEPSLVDVARFTVNARTTLHWTINHIVESHANRNYEDNDIVILEPARALFPHLYGGYPEDYFSIGPYALSHESILFYPIAKQQIVQQQLGMGFRGTLIPYSAHENLRTQVKTYVAQKLGPDYPYVRFDQKVRIKFSETIAKIPGGTGELYKRFKQLHAEQPDFFRENNLYLPAENGARRRINVNQVTARNFSDVEFELNAEPEHLKVTIGAEQISCARYFAAWHTHLGPMMMHCETPLSALEKYADTIQALLDTILSTNSLLLGEQLIQTVLENDACLPLLAFLQKACRDIESLTKTLVPQLQQRRLPAATIHFFQESMALRRRLWLALMTTTLRKHYLDRQGILSVLRSVTLPDLSRPVNIELTLDYLRALNPKITGYGHALRLWAANQLPQWTGAEIFRQAPAQLNEAGAGSGKTALDFAVERHNSCALEKLRLWGAQPGRVLSGTRSPLATMQSGP